MSTSELEIRINELQSKSKLSITEKAELNSLKVRLDKEKSRMLKKEGKGRPSAFGLVATTKTNPLPIRFLENERVGLSVIRDTLVSEHAEYIIQELGSLNEINETKLVRASVEILNEIIKTDPCRIIDAIKRVKMNMIR